LSDFDILCFTESHLDDQVTDAYLVSGCSNYTLYRRYITPHSGGVAVYISNGLFCRRRLDLELSLVQFIWLDVKYKPTCFLLCVIYRPPNARVALWNDINLRIERALDVNHNLIIMGDLNENLLVSNNVNLRTILLLNTLENVINEPTRITATFSALIDSIIVSSSIVFCKSGCLAVDNTISDHKLTFIYVRSTPETNVCKTRKVWLYNRADFQRFNELNITECWDFINTLTADEACNKLTETCIPSKTVTIRPNDKHWYDSEIRRCTKYRDRRRRIAIKNDSPANWSKYKQLRNKVNNLKLCQTSLFYQHIQQD